MTSRWSWMPRPNFNPRPHTGATGPERGPHGLRGISIHAPIRGRRPGGMFAINAARFQSTPPYGGDRPGSGTCGTPTHFNPRPHTGATEKNAGPQANTAFQSTPPYGGDKALFNLAASALNFNPRPHTGATQLVAELKRYRLISIHAPIRGRPEETVQRAEIPDFNPRPHTGATWSCWPSSPISIFQSTPPYGGDPSHCRRSPCWTYFNHAPIRGRLSDETIRYSQVHSSCFAKVISNISKAPSPGAFSFCLLSPRACRTIRTN